ncbi:uncharacterized protein EMH_0015700 [Eimeria mitis]|uniref:SAM-dependent methyltransferase RsmB-F/NOP2-type catalytic core domain-containing protein n=1 Tax=Eimeria mitis TaxID=44415 RepID=U6KD12_9EIME|nr:uncharacterized protein EMH_0015700 [Eimeria mitis]CDJ33343.1 hypothetical protein, conserved [Eimeria mitis]
MSIRGGACWSATYSKQYGEARWKSLLNALAEVPNQLAFVSPSISHSALRYLIRKPRFAPCLIPNCFSFEGPTARTDDKKDDAAAECAASVSSDSRGQLPTDQNTSGNVAIVEDEHIAEEARAKTYFLDGEETEGLLVCNDISRDRLARLQNTLNKFSPLNKEWQAPGGKSLIILSMLTQAKVPSYIIGGHSMLSETNSVENDEETEGLLVCNDISRDRLARLQNTLNKFLPSYSTAGQRLQFSCADICRGGAFGTPKAHAERQLKMLRIASKLLKKDGILLYSTCALSELENDAVIEKFLKKMNGNVKILPLFDGEWPAEVKVLDQTGSGLCTKTEHSDNNSLFSVEKLKYGYAMLPDISSFGPMYFCKMQITGH